MPLPRLPAVALASTPRFVRPRRGIELCVLGLPCFRLSRGVLRRTLPLILRSSFGVGQRFKRVAPSRWHAAVICSEHRTTGGAVQVLSMLSALLGVEPAGQQGHWVWSVSSLNEEGGLFHDLVQ